MNTLYWLTDDLRIEDNPALTDAALGETLTIIFCIDEQCFRTDRFGNRGMGKHRWRFLRESLLDLQHDLQEYGQTLHLLSGEPGEVVSELLQKGPFDKVVRTRQHSIKDVERWHALIGDFPEIAFVEHDGSTLFSLPTLSFDNEFPATFSQFRRALETAPFRPVVSQPTQLPKPSSFELDSRLAPPPNKTVFPSGGASNGKHHLDAYFGTFSASTYKETRNDLSGTYSSTGFSPWLAHGCLSPMYILERLRQYEATNGVNESTGWIVFELMWREFFRWHARHHGESLFEFSGVTGKRPLTSFYRERFLKWRDGTTPWGIVNACMHELRETGYLSNRGRQIVASCLVNELELDWRCGAGYFEEQLVDYDPCSNQGNWQYIAGVGSDPRGGRHFDLVVQAKLWDADGDYRERWAGKEHPQPLDSMDYYDWPMEAKHVDSP